MKEDIFFKVGVNTSYLEETKKKKWTSKIGKKITEHKFLLALFVIVIICFIMNFWLIYSFMDILSKQIVIK